MFLNRIFIIFVFISLILTGCSEHKNNNNNNKNNEIKVMKFSKYHYYGNINKIPNTFNRYESYLNYLFSIFNISEIVFPMSYKDLSNITFFEHQFNYINKIINKGIKLYNIFNKKNICSYYNKEAELKDYFGIDVIDLKDISNKKFYESINDFLNKKYKGELYTGIIVLNKDKNNFSFISVKKSKPFGIELYCDAYKVLKITDWKFFKNLNKYLKIEYIFDNQLSQLDKIIIELKDINKKNKKNSYIRLEVSFIVKSKYIGNDIYKSLNYLNSIKKIKFYSKNSENFETKYYMDLFMKIPNDINLQTSIFKKKIFNKLVYKYNYKENKDYYILYEGDLDNKTIIKGNIFIYQNDGTKWNLINKRKLVKGSLLPF